MICGLQNTQSDRQHINNVTDSLSSQGKKIRGSILTSGIRTFNMKVKSIYVSWAMSVATVFQCERFGSPTLRCAKCHDTLQMMPIWASNACGMHCLTLLMSKLVEIDDET